MSARMNHPYPASHRKAHGRDLDRRASSRKRKRPDRSLSSARRRKCLVPPFPVAFWKQLENTTAAQPKSVMAIHPKLSPAASWSPRPRRPRRPRPQENANLTPQQASEISAWTEQAAESLENLHLSSVRNQDEPTSPSPACRSSPALTIPLDVDHHVERTPTPLRSKHARIAEVEAHVQETARVIYRRREPLRRDSLKRREALLMGKEGSRRRQRWENGTS